jgi:hypothetical protein
VAAIDSESCENEHNSDALDNSNGELAKNQKKRNERRRLTKSALLKIKKYGKSDDETTTSLSLTDNKTGLEHLGLFSDTLYIVPDGLLR